MTRPRQRSRYESPNTRGLVDVPVSTAVILALGEPVVASLLGTFLLGERLSAVAWVGYSETVTFCANDVPVAIESARSAQHAQW
jgi:threonine/homoserine efflux transporter RhtA